MSLNNEIKKELKLLIIGDCQVGKSCILSKYLHKNKYENNNNNNDEDSMTNDDLVECSSFDQYKPSALSVYKCDVQINNVIYNLSLTDTSGNRHIEQFVQLRKNYYIIAKDIDVILMCFSLVDPHSFSNLSKKWYPEIKENYLDVPILLVGTKLDRKHCLKLEKKSFSNKKSFELTNTPESTKKLISNNNNMIQQTDLEEPEVQKDISTNQNENESVSIQNQHCFCRKCNFCNHRTPSINPEQTNTNNNNNNNRNSKGSSFLSSLTSKVVNLSDSKTRAVSIVSKVSQQHAILGSVPLLLANPITIHDQHTKSLVDIQISNNNIINILLEENNTNNNNNNNELNDISNNKFDLAEYELSDDQLESSEYLEVNNNSNNIENYNNLNYYQNYDNETTEQCNELINTDQISIKTDNSQQTLPIDGVEVENEEELRDQQYQPYMTIVDRPEETAIKKRDCLKLKASMNARKYMECSCLNDTDVFDVMNSAIGFALEYHLNKIKKNKKLVKQSSDMSKKSSLFHFGSFKKENSTATTKQIITTTTDTTAAIVAETASLSNKRDENDDNNNKDEIKSEKRQSKIDSIKHEEIIVVADDLDKESNKSKNKSIIKPKKSKLRCLSCTRGSETQTSLNKI